MNMHRAYELAALISKPKGLKGEIVVLAPDGLPLRLCEGLEVWVVPPTLKGVRQTRVSSLSPQAKGLCITLEGVENIEAARELAGRHLLARASDLEQLKDLSVSRPSYLSPQEILSDTIGCTVVDKTAGTIGIVQWVEDNPAHPLLAVQTEEHVVFIPYVEEFILDCQQDTIRVQLPSGLLDLNR